MEPSYHLKQGYWLCTVWKQLGGSQANQNSWYLWLQMTRTTKPNYYINISVRNATGNHLMNETRRSCDNNVAHWHICHCIVHTVSHNLVFNFKHSQRHKHSCFSGAIACLSWETIHIQTKILHFIMNAKNNSCSERLTGNNGTDGEWIMHHITLYRAKTLSFGTALPRCHPDI